MNHETLLLNHFCFFTIASTAQKNNKAYKITYSRTSNGKTIEGQDPVWYFRMPMNLSLLLKTILPAKPNIL
ncbi:hypothetical protein H9W95_19385 [Flavobacterium lindanitolerans]|nr:hypothetical protein [Flavobacterium lindanitolerans]